MEVVIDYPSKKAKELRKILELERMKRERSEVRLRSSRGKLRIRITAKDPSAARAVANTYLKLLNVLEKVDSI
ncbi:hypothetical protein DRN62_00735 [Nanoarchaeota archaeon]|nr:MAG: hypothetical protein DRN62_00735 [Nanoarchaeota archaeon]